MPHRRLIRGVLVALMRDTVFGAGSHASDCIAPDRIAEDVMSAPNRVDVGADEDGPDAPMPLQRRPPSERGPSPPRPGFKQRLSFWSAFVLLLVLLGVGSWALLHSRASIALNVASVDGSLALSGLVLYRGHVVQSGTIHLAVSSAYTKHHLGSTTLSVSEGRFELPVEEGAFDDVVGTDELRIDARFWGVVLDDGAERAVEADTTVWNNCSAPITREDVSVVLMLFALLSGFVIVLFTMELTQFWARVLFATSYLATFLSVTVPLVVIAYVSQNPYLTQLMEKSPFGLVRAHTASVSETQWLLNVGGTIEKDLSKQRENGSASLQARSAALIDIAGPDGFDALPPASEGTGAEGSAAGMGEAPLIVRGGLAIPFYVIILAIFGAGINMMRRIPDIQAKHVMELKAGPLTRPAAGSATRVSMAPGETQAACDIRQAVIEQHMYLLAAPFLAIAVYFLLQILANDIAQPVIVLMAFSAGLISERIVAAVIGVAGRTLGDRSDSDDTDAANDIRESGAPPARGGR